MSNSVIKSENISIMPAIEEGDAGVILKKSGEFVVFNTHRELDPKNLTPRQIEQGEQIIGIAAALRLPALMQVLINAANDPNLFTRAVELPARH